jgi:hypothetical protein
MFLFLGENGEEFFSILMTVNRSHLRVASNPNLCRCDRVYSGLVIKMALASKNYYKADQEVSRANNK